MPFLDRFRRRADRLPEPTDRLPEPTPEPDDPRVSSLAAEIGRARGITYDWLLWSGGLLGDSDAANEATALVRKRWWHFKREPQLVEIDEGLAADLLSWLIGHTLAYDSELMTSEGASTFAATFMSLVPTPRRWFSNCEESPSGPPSAFGWDSATKFTFDLGVVAVADGRAWIAWFTDED